MKNVTLKIDKMKIMLNTLFWGFIIWFFGYILGFVFYAFVPKNLIGWFVMPLGLVFTLCVLFKKIKREEFMCYIGLGVIWTILAVALDYVFLVKLLSATDYYKLDVYMYYILTFVLPIIVGAYKFKKSK